jgi:hypothetical protein
MSTRSWIGIEHEEGLNQEGNVEMIYSHWDGYPKHHGKILEEHYQDVGKINRLLAVGPISVFAANVEAPEGAIHTYEKPLKDVVISYARDRDPVEDYATYKFATIEEMLGQAAASDAEYVYLYTKKDGWLVWDLAELPISSLVRPKVCDVLKKTQQ